MRVLGVYPRRAVPPAPERRLNGTPGGRRPHPPGPATPPGRQLRRRLRDGTNGRQERSLGWEAGVPETREPIAAFTEEQTERLTGISKRQLRYWDQTGFFVPSLAYRNRRSPYSRLYSFRDLVSLRVINALRNEAKVPLPHLREVKEKLAQLGEPLWAKTTLYVLNRSVIFDNPETAAREEIVTGQAVLAIPLRVVSGNVELAVKSLRQRDASLIGKIERQRNIAHNAPVIAGTRVPVRSIKLFAKAGYSIEDIRREYPTLTEADIAAAIGYEAAA
ncbi:MAG: DUF433 domain-containing protein [Acetobacteraceae bacterium]